MSKKKTAEKATIEATLALAINATGVAEVVRYSQDGNSIKVLFRVKEKRTWLAILEYVLARADGWSAHVCQQYFIRGGKMVFGWNFILQSEDLLAAVDKVSVLLRGGARVVPKNVARGPLESFPLVGAPRNRTAHIQFDPRLPGPSRGGPSHKGAYGIKGE